MIRSVSVYIFFILVLSTLIRTGFDEIASTPKMKLLEQRNIMLKNSYKELEQKIAHSEHVLSGIQKRDDNVYRSVLKQDPLPGSVREGGFGGVRKMAGGILDLEEFEIINNTATQLERLSTKALIQSWSIKDLFKAARDHSALKKSIPAIHPLSPSDTFWLSSSYGHRRDPFHGFTRMHTGIDLAGEPGLKVYATGDGKVVEAMNSRSGYGKEVLIDHGFGYMSRYGHLRQILVREGQVVKRGDVLGTLGNTGRSTGPHLHYEVIHNDRFVNPMYFYREDMTGEEYMSITSMRNP